MASEWDDSTGGRGDRGSPCVRLCLLAFYGDDLRPRQRWTRGSAAPKKGHRVDHTAGNGTRSGNCTGHRETKWHTSPDEMTSCRAAPHRTAPGQRSPTGRAYSRWFRDRPAAHHIPVEIYCIPTPTPPPGVPKHPPRKRKGILPYQGPDDTDETLRSTRLKRS
ncbi:hypothetical protein SCLCIDRAFT_29434 [Scleroderma citrinum Foug A]|uniref:Uncharacterized protein n=1 Tax=Scleroderma citrinum Foug A TaxID=1036808 RepID=A0A0C2Z3X6_9AGAM|nr:hypothetical protein SCLCIDRAFT_29434 [Scleroderma citrinum Foug A]